MYAIYYYQIVKIFNVRRVFNSQFWTLYLSVNYKQINNKHITKNKDK